MSNKSKLLEYLESIHIDEFNMSTLDANALKEEIVQKKLLSCDEFKNVKKINIISMPCYHGDLETGQPIEFCDDNLGDKSKAKVFHTVSRNYDPQKHSSDIFNEEIDLYCISLSPRIYDPTKITAENLGIGVWVMPTLYHRNSFEPYKEIRVVFSPETIQDLMSVNKEDLVEIVKTRILKSVEKAIDEGLKENVPFERTILFRASERSFKKNL
jgi:hypothetical protein